MIIFNQSITITISISKHSKTKNRDSPISFLRSWNINNPYNDAFILVSTFRRWYHAKYLHLSRTAFIVSTVESRGNNPGFRFCKPTALSINEVGSSLQLLPSRIRPNVTRILMHTNGYTHVLRNERELLCRRFAETRKNPVTDINTLLQIESFRENKLSVQKEPLHGRV